MGTTVAQGYAEAVAEGLIQLEGALGAHLQYNFFPPLPGAYAKPLALALDMVACDEGDDLVSLPADLNPLPRQAFQDEDGNVVVTAVHLVEVCKAWSFLDLLVGNYDE